MKHTGRNETNAPIYLVHAETVTVNARARHGVSFKIDAVSYTDRDEALAALGRRIEAALDRGENTSVSLKIKRPGSSTFVARKAGE